jgi:hypothetical protein
VAIAIPVSAAIAGEAVSAPDGNTQSIESTISPKALPKTTATAATLKVTTATGTTTAANGVPSPPVFATIDFDKNASIFTKGLPTCNPALLQNTSTEAAEQACGKAKIGTGSAVALLPTSSQVFEVPQTVTAFNGVPKGGKPVVILHSYGTTPLQTTLVLVGTVSNYGKEGYGPRLEIEIPKIAGGSGALVHFQVTINKKWTYKGQQRSFVSAKCTSGTLKTRGTFTFLDGQSATAFSTQKCTPKK